VRVRAGMTAVTRGGGACSADLAMAVDVVMAATAQGVAALERAWESPGPRFVQITAQHRTRCGGCAGEVPVSTLITYDRLEHNPYHPGCAWVAIERPAWLIPLFAGDAPAPGQVLAHPSYGWLICVRVAGQTWADNGMSSASIVGVAARRALPEEVELAQWRASAGMGDEGEWSWLEADHVSDLVEEVAEFTGWPVTRMAREPKHVAVPHPRGLVVFGEVAPREDSERWIAADAAERSRYQCGYRWCRCYSVACVAGEEGHVHLGSVIPISRQAFDAANQRGWTLR